MSDQAKLGWIALLTLLGLGFSALAFGADLTPRPIDYTPIDYLSTRCLGLVTDATVFRFGVEGDTRWLELYIEDTPGHARLVAIAAYAPGANGQLTLAEVLLPSGQVVQFHSPQELRDSPYAEVCAVAAVWLNRI